MNRIYKVIWSKVRHCYVVVSELAKKDGKSVSTSGRVSKKMATSLAVMALCAGMTSGVMAVNTATGTGSGIAYGTGSKAPNAGSVAVGYNANAAGDYSLALGMQANSSGYLSIAQGYAAQASGLQSVAIGLQTQATNEASTAIGRSVQATGLASIGIGLSGVAAGNDSIVMGREATATTTAVNGIALGIGSYIGAEVTPGGQPSEGVPDNSLAVTDDDTSSGKPDQDHMNSIALGNTAKAFGYQNTSLGAGSETYDTNSLAVGVAAHARGNYASAIGKQASAYGLESTALGHWARAYGDNAIAIGTNSITFSLDGTDSVNNAIAIGQKARVASNNSIALGQNSLAYIPNGVTTKAYLTDEAFSADNGIVSVGNTEYKIGEDAVAENRRRITNVAGGAESYDAVNVAQLKAVNDKVDANKISFFSVNPEGFVVTSNEDNKGATGYHAMAIGIDASATGLQDIAIGKGAVASEGSGISIGLNSKATGGMATAIGEGTAATKPSTVALGTAAEATQTLAVAIGGAAKSQHYNTVAIGAYANAMNISSIAIGNLASTSDMADNGVSIGRETRNTVPNGIALGSYSVADRRENILSYDPLTESNFNFTPEMQTALDAWNAAAAVYYQNPTPENAQAAKDAGMKYRAMVAPWMAGMGSLSLGNGEEGLTRQITNVAAGTIDTDAVNVAQLKSAKVEVLAGTNISSIDKDTSSGYTQYKVNAKDTITDSAALSGDTITFTRNDGTTYTVNGVASTSALSSNKTQYFSVKSIQPINKDNTGATGSESVAIGPGTTVSGAYGVALGANTSVTNTESIAMGYVAKGTGMYATAVGSRAEATADRALALGIQAQATGSGSVAVGNTAKAKDATSVAIGTQTEAGNGAVVVGHLSAAGSAGIALGGNTQASGYASIALGDSAEAAGTQSIALGYQANGKGTNSVVLGNQAKGTAMSSVGIGFLANASGDQSTSLGGATRASGAYSTALGYSARATAKSSSAIGSYSVANITTGVALGLLSETSGGKGTIGYDPTGAITSRDTVLGNNKSAYDQLQTDIATEKNNINDINSRISALQTERSSATDERKAEIDAQLKTERAALTSAQNNVDTMTANANKLLFTWESTLAGVSVGSSISGLSRQINNVAAGTLDTDAVNVAQLKAVNSKVDANKIQFFSVNPEGSIVTSNADNEGASGSHAIAIGVDTSASGSEDVALGKGAVASGGTGISIGARSKSSGGLATAVGERAEATRSASVALGSSAKATQNYAIAIGGAAKATDYQTVAMGAYANALVEDSVAIGYFATASDNAYDGVAIGRSSNVSAENGLALGRNANATMANGIALGSYSITDRDGNYLGYDPTVGGDFVFTSEMQAALEAANAAIYERNQNPTPENDQIALEAIKKYKLLVAPWVSGASAVSIGNKEEGLTRQITNVAAGGSDTDAVNVAQLKSAKVEVLAGANISSIDKDTSAGYTQYKINAKDTITDSAALSGDTITFTRNDGTTYKVSGLASTSALETNKTKYFSVKSTDAGNRNNDGATGENALAVGVRAKATNTADTAIGYNASASGSWGIAAGAGSKSTGALGIAMGYGANAAANQAIAIGYAATVTKADSLAIGRETQANEANAMAIGLTAKANANQSMALGYGALTESTANNGIAMGVDAYVGAIRSTDPVQGIPGNSTSIVDDDTVVAPEKAQMNFVAIGNSAKAFGYQTTALGAGAEAHDTNSLAVGIMAIGKGNYATALGKQAYANGNEATALGHWARAYGDNAIAIGSYAITNTLDGTGTVSNGVAIGQKARAASDNSVALGQNSLAYVPDNVKTEAYLTNEAFAASNGVVSVGNAEYTIGDTTVASNRRRITNVAGGADDHDAVNVAQLKALSNKLTQDAADSKLSSGKNITINTTTDGNGVKTNTIDLNDKITLNNAAAPGQQVIVDGTTSNIAAGTGDNQVVVDGSAGQVTIGAEGSQLVIGKQADTAKDKDGNVINPDKTGNYITGLDNTTWNPAENGIVENRAATEGQLRDAVNSISTEIGDINTDIEAIQNAKRDFISDTGEKIEVGNAETLSIKGGAAANSLTEGNIGVVNDGTKGFKVKLSSKLSGLDSVSAKTVAASDSITVGSGDTTTVISGDAVTTGNTTVNTKGLTVTGSDDSTTITVQSDNVSMGGNKIQNVAAGKDITDAVNVGQLNEAVTTIGSGMNQLGNQINKLDNRVDRVGAGAAALAALHPLEYDPNTRWEVSAGVGNYRGANAVAVGAFYRPNYDTMVSIGSSYGGGENMVNAGVTWRIGEGGSGNYQSKGAMAQEINDLRSVVDEQNSKLASQSSQIESQSEQLSAQSNEIKAQRQQLEEQNKKIEQLMQAIEDLKK